MNPTHPLILDAALSGNLTVIKCACEKEGVKIVEVKDKRGWCALHYAASAGRTHICRYLIGQLKVNVDVKDHLGNTPLLLASKGEQYATSAYLLNQGAQPSMANNNGMTPLHYAAEEGRKDLLCLLISKGADVDAESTRDGTPLHCAAIGETDAVKILLDNHANPNIVASFSGTPLFIAVTAGSIDCVRLLLKAGADPNLSSTGNTPLIIAAVVGGKDMINCLLKAGADPNVTNFYDFTPIELAAIHGDHANVEALFQATNRIQGIPEWTPCGIVEYVNSHQVENKTSLKLEPKFHEAKDHGTQAFKRNDYHSAIFWYSVALDVKPCDAAVLSNRSLCFVRVNEGEMAVKDALSCVMLRGDWPKAYYRAGVAWKIMGEKKNAVKAFEMGTKLDPENEELKDAYRDAMEELQNEVVGDFSNLPFCHRDSDDDDYYNYVFGYGFVFEP